MPDQHSPNWWPLIREDLRKALDSYNKELIIRKLAGERDGINGSARQSPSWQLKFKDETSSDPDLLRIVNSASCSYERIIP